VAKPFVFVYLPKTGSTPLLAHLGRHLVWNQGIVFLGPWGDRQRHRDGRPDISVWSSTKRSKVRVITGTEIDMASHEFGGADQGRYFTVLSDPADRLVADYNALLGRKLDLPGFWDWHDGRRVNQTTRRFRELFDVETADEISERLRDFWYVTTTEHLDDDAPNMLERMKVKGEWGSDGNSSDADLDDVDATESGEIATAAAPAAGRIVVTDELRDRIYAAHPKDRRLHKLALRRRATKRAKYGWD